LTNSSVLSIDCVLFTYACCLVGFWDDDDVDDDFSVFLSSCRFLNTFRKSQKRLGEKRERTKELSQSSVEN